MFTKTWALTEGLVVGFETALTSIWMVKMQCDLEEFLFRECSAMVQLVLLFREEGGEE